MHQKYSTKKLALKEAVFKTIDENKRYLHRPKNIVTDDNCSVETDDFGSRSAMTVYHFLRVAWGKIVFYPLFSKNSELSDNYTFGQKFDRPKVF